MVVDRTLVGRQHLNRDPCTNHHLGDLDLNDPQTLEFYTELAMFKRDDSREILVFPPGIAPEHRRSIHILAHHMGLEHQSMGEADARQLTVLKRQPSPTINAPPPASALDVHKRGLSRAATFDFAADRESRGASNNYAHMMGRQNPTLEIPGSPEGGNIPNNLRAAKSFADLRSFTPSPSQASSSYLAPGPSMGGTSTARFGDYMAAGGHPGTVGTPGPRDNNGLISGLSNLNLGAFDANAMQAQARSTPGAIGSQRPGAGGNNPKGAPTGNLVALSGRTLLDSADVAEPTDTCPAAVVSCLVALSLFYPSLY